VKLKMIFIILSIKNKYFKKTGKEKEIEYKSYNLWDIIMKYF